MLYRLTAFIVLLCVQPATAQTDLTHTYTLAVRGITVARATLDADIETGSFRVEASAAGSGLVSVFVNGAYSAVATGQWDGGSNFQTQRFSQTTAVNDEVERVALTYRGGTPVARGYSPERGPDERPLPPLSAQYGTLDPLTSILSLVWPGSLQDICSRRIDSFSGSRRTLVTTQIANANPPDPSCTVTYFRVDGFDPSSMEEQSAFPFTMSLRQREDGLYEVDEIRGDTRVGTAVLRRTN